MVSSLRAILHVLGYSESIDAFPWEKLRYDHVQAIRAALAQRYKPATTNRHLVALRGVLSHAHRLGYLTAEELSQVKLVKAVPGSTAKRGRMLSPEEIRTLLAGCSAEGDARGRRDAALLAVAAYSGLRRFEIAALDLADFDPKAQKLTVKRGKGGKYREVFLPPEACAHLAAWIADRKTRSGPLFCPTSRGRHLRAGLRLGQGAIHQIICDRCVRAHLPKTTTHDFRRTFASTLLDHGVDLVTVRDLLGHESVETTMNYDRRGDARKKRAAETLAQAFATEGA